MKTELLNERLDEIWTKHCSADADALVPLYHHTTTSGGIVFIGMNPSFSQKSIDQGLRQKRVFLNDVLQYFLWANRENFDLQVCRLLGEWSHNHYAYFKHFRELAETLGRKWHHLDLYAFRATNQKEFMQYLASKPEFDEAQLEVFDNALEQCSPALIVVANAKASEIFKRRYKLHEIDDKVGHHQLNLSGRIVPVFCSGMWTGGRALDIHSRERLIWHIKKTLAP